MKLETKMMYKELFKMPMLYFALPGLFLAITALVLKDWKLAFDGIFMASVVFAFTLSELLHRQSKKLIDAQRIYIKQLEAMVVDLRGHCDEQTLSANKKESLKKLLNILEREP